jgi:hypothetical protein
MQTKQNWKTIPLSLVYFPRGKRARNHQVLLQSENLLKYNRYVSDLVFSSRLGERETASEKPLSAKSSLLGRRVIALDPVRESTPVNDLRDVSTYLKRPVSPVTSTPNRSPRQPHAITPSSLPPLPPSPSKSLAVLSPNPQSVTVLPTYSHDLLQTVRECLVLLRGVSDANI